MSGTQRGGMNAAKTNKQIYGEDFYKIIGKLGGKKSRGGWFQNTENARKAGKLGGLKHKRPIKITDGAKSMTFDSIGEAAEAFKVSRTTIVDRLRKGHGDGMKWERL